VSMASDCMAYVYASRKKFETLLAAQRQDPVRKEINPATPEEIAAIKAARKKGLSWHAIGEMFQRAPSFCRSCYLR